MTPDYTPGEWIDKTLFFPPAELDEEDFHFEQPSGRTFEKIDTGYCFIHGIGPGNPFAHAAAIAQLRMAHNFAKPRPNKRPLFARFALRLWKMLR
jgi:hypothetical protein